LRIGLNLTTENISKDLSDNVLNDINLQFAQQIGISDIISQFVLPVGNGYWEFIIS
jgi:hypothetical protein